MLFIVFFTVLFSSLYPTPLQAQTTSFPFEKKINPVKKDSTYFLGWWVIASTLSVEQNGQKLPSSAWSFSSINGELKFTSALTDTVNELWVKGRSRPIGLKREYRFARKVRLDSSLFANTDSLTGFINRNQRRPARFDDSGLNQRGSLSRGIIVGTNQDFALESGLNFELNGPITDNINISASLTDQSIPIQPEGTTQNLREFDKVYIELSSQSAELKMGDVDISYGQNTFTQLNRRLQGAAFKTSASFGDYQGALSVIRGTYKSMSFQGSDGVQGPYRLTGENGEEFVIILAGTEKVYINGSRVSRGAENDYIIDYGLGEVTFTSNVLIKDETRIVIEYEYIDQNFNRTLVAAEGNQEFLDGRFSIGASVFRQADGNDLLSQRSLTQNDIDILKQAGDNLGEATVSGAKIATQEERDKYVLYAKVDTVVNGNNYSIYKHLPGNPESVYRVRFSKAGAGQGSYIRTGGQVNGILYEWVGPGNGSYTPFRQLPAPEKHEMVAFNSLYKISENARIYGEWAFSNFDKNRFSTLDDDDNNDLAYKTGLEINDQPTAWGTLDVELSRRFSGTHFEYFERTREVEFDRKWNLSRNYQSRESINEAVFRLRPTEDLLLGADAGYLERDQFRGFRQAAIIQNTGLAGIQLNYTQDWVDSKDEALSLDGQWFRHRGNVNRSFRVSAFRLTPFVGFEQEKRLQRSTETDSLTQMSLAFYEVGPGLNIRTGPVEMEAGIVYRDEDRVLENKLADQAVALEQSYKLNFLPEKGRYFSSRNEVRVRDKTFKEAFRTRGDANRKGLLIKSLTEYRLRNDLLEGDLYYQANTQRRAVFQESYVEVGPEIGQYVWDDLNRDGVQQVDEFFPELSPNEGTFIRQLLPSDELFPVIDLSARAVHALRPLQGLGEDQLFSGLTIHSRVDLRENSTTDRLSDIYLLKLNTFRKDSTTLSGRIFWEKEADFFPSLREADLRLGYRQNRSLNRRSVESIRNFTDLYFLEGAYNITSQTRMLLEIQAGESRSISSRLNSRNYDIQSYRIRPGVNTTISRSWNTGLNLGYILRRDRYPATEAEARIIKIESHQRAYLWNRIQTNLQVEVRNTRLEGISSVYGNYELTEGTGEGTHLIWALQSSYRISNLMRLSLDYDGRTVKNRPTIHTVKLVMSAVF